VGNGHFRVPHASDTLLHWYHDARASDHFPYSLKTMKPTETYEAARPYESIFFALHNFRFATVFFFMKIAESKKLVLGRCVIDFDEIKVWLMISSWRLNICKVYYILLEIFRANVGEECDNFETFNITVVSINQRSMHTVRRDVVVVAGEDSEWRKSGKIDVL
jgi:hypothetical protein